VFVTKSADVKTAAKRIAWGKVHNAGQICLGPDYVLIHPSLEREFVESFKNALEIYLPNGAQASPDYGKIVNDRNFNRIKKLLDNSGGAVLCGGSVDESTRFIEPTLVKVTNSSDSLLSEEIFGPVIPMMVVEKVDEMVLLAKRLGDTPLAMYVFSADKLEQEKSKSILAHLGRPASVLAGGHFMLANGELLFVNMMNNRGCSSQECEVWGCLH
jgi:beta-apo-4'-carotenal oxygenase